MDSAFLWQQLSSETRPWLTFGGCLMPLLPWAAQVVFVWCRGWVSLRSTQFRKGFLHEHLTGATSLCFGSKRQTCLASAFPQKQGAFFLCPKGKSCSSLGHWGLLILILGGLEENKALCLSLLIAAWHLLTSIDIRILEWSPMLAPGFLTSSQYRSMRLWVGACVYGAQLFQTKEADHALPVAVHWDSILVLVLSGFSGWNLGHLNAS